MREGQREEFERVHKGGVGHRPEGEQGGSALKLRKNNGYGWSHEPKDCGSRKQDSDLEMMEREL